MTGPTTQSFVSQNLRLRYVDWGNPDAPPLILLHGGQDHCRSWDWVAEELRNDWHIIAPDLRGHGDSDRSPSGDYSIMSNVYDLAQLIHQRKLTPVTIVGHSYGGNVVLRYTGLYPENVRKLVVIEGLGPSPKVLAERYSKPLDERLREWIDTRRKIAGRLPRRYETLEAAFERMKEQNHHLSEEQARHLTIHGIAQNEDGTYSWKYDNTFRAPSPVDLSPDELHALWGRVTCPALLLYGEDSWASNPMEDGRIQYFTNAKVHAYEKAGHWLHHDQFERFIGDLRAFL